MSALQTAKILMTVIVAGILIGCATQGKPPVAYLCNKDSGHAVFKPGSEPNGFGDIAWETELSTLDRMILYRTDPSFGGIEFYVKNRDTFKLGEGKLERIQYGFRGGRFSVGSVRTKGFSNWNTLKDAVFAQFGEGAKPFSNCEEYLWTGEKAVMALRYDESSEEGLLYIRTASLTKE